ncbi:9053_t:CDS:2 [Ambispora gerdemannii]|uniref:9053_t:CDS:1 n=1 Tax=Ambispora gerdemannii TaxID=144530 RepID=A0A9N9BP15_9GLOM|nr:9053_t:CDS:2 [Ambispora gerdemannii]
MFVSNRDVKSPVRFWNRKVCELDELNCSPKSVPDLVQELSSELRSRTGSSECGPVLIDARGDEKTAKGPGSWFLGTNRLKSDPRLSPDLVHADYLTSLVSKFQQPLAIAFMIRSYVALKKPFVSDENQK